MFCEFRRRVSGNFLSPLLSFFRLENSTRHMVGGIFWKDMSAGGAHGVVFALSSPKAVVKPTVMPPRSPRFLSLPVDRPLSNADPKIHLSRPSRLYLQKVRLYREPAWTCTRTSRSGLSYLQAVASENAQRTEEVHSYLPSACSSEQSCHDRMWPCRRSP